MQSHTNGLHEQTRPADCCANTAQNKRPSTRASLLMKAVAGVFELPKRVRRAPKSSLPKREKRAPKVEVVYFLLSLIF